MRLETMHFVETIQGIGFHNLSLMNLGQIFRNLRSRAREEFHICHDEMTCQMKKILVIRKNILLQKEHSSNSNKYIVMRQQLL